MVVSVNSVNSHRVTVGPRSFVASVCSDEIIDRAINDLPPPPCRNRHVKIKTPPEINRIDLIFASFEQGLPIKLSYGCGNMKKYERLVVLNNLKECVNPL